MLTPDEKKKIKEYFHKEWDQLSTEEIEEKQKALRAKYHPDKFEQYQNELVKELAISRYHEIEALVLKWKTEQTESPTGRASTDPTPQYAYEGMAIEIITKDKNLKYQLFGSRYAFLLAGDHFRIPGSKARIIIDSRHSGLRIGYTESIQAFLSFGKEDDLELIFRWLLDRIRTDADFLYIEGQKMAIDLETVLTFVRSKSILLLD
jgi:hypothetical protein